MYGRRVPKTHPRVSALGAVDELNAALGIVRASTGDKTLVEPALRDIQKDLVVLMGELATSDEDRDRYTKDKFRFIDGDLVDRLTRLAVQMEGDFEIRFRGWAIPGEHANLPSAYLDLARTICRRSEREVWALHEQSPLPNAEVPKYLNRLSDVLWLLARYEDCMARGEECEPCTRERPD
jgi:cob(I)alamin adenosyltransferase